jgi:predicted ATPase
MRSCACQDPHERRRIVLTGGPGAGKTAVLELIRQYFCVHVKVLPEAAGVVFGGGFPRESSPEARRAAQRAIYFIQRELESAADGGHPAIVLCDRGTVDGAAYWPGPDTLWSSVATTRDAELARYDAVIHLRTPGVDGGYNQTNPLRIESAVEAAALDERIADEWQGHPRRFLVEASADFLVKSRRALTILRDEMPACCRGHIVPPLDGIASGEEVPA